MDTFLTCLGGRTYDQAQHESLGFVVRTGGVSLLLECGPYTVQKLRTVLNMSVCDLTYLYISHNHFDHAGGLPALVQALMFDPYFGYSSPGRLTCLTPQDMSLDILDSAKRCYPDAVTPTKPKPDDSVLLTAQLPYLLPGQDHTIRHLDALKLDHTIPCWALKLWSDDGAMVYVPDSRASVIDTIPRWIERAELLLVCIAGSRAGAGSYSEEYGFMTAYDAGVLGTRLGAKTLVLAHVYDVNDQSASLDEAALSFQGEVLLARSGLDVPVRL